MTSLKSLAQTAMLATNGELVLPGEEIPVATDGETGSEARLLSAAAVIGIREIGSRIPPSIEGGGEPCPPETRPRLSGRAARLLNYLLTTSQPAVLLEEFLRIAAAKGCVAPPHLLPSLLGIQQKEWIPYLRAIAGERGRWLAARNPAWAFALVQPGEEDWETGTLEQRLALLRRVRSRSPAQALEMVERSWQQDPPEERAAFLEVLSVGLSMQDEPFLEACQGDRRREVREAARSLLTRLPDSRFAARGAARVEPYLAVRSRFLLGEALDVILPPALDEETKKDGIGGPVLRKALGERANWLAQMLSVVPPSYWSARWKRSPEKLLALAVACEWKEAVLLGWVQAAERCGDPDWAAAFAELWVKNKDARAVLLRLPEELVRSVSVEKLHALAQASITPAVHELDDNHPLLFLLMQYDRPWSPELARTVMASVRRQAGSSRYQLLAALGDFALRVPPALADELTRGWPADLGSWQPAVNTFTQNLRFRNEMMEAV